MTSPGKNPRPTESENLSLASCAVEYFDVCNVHLVRHAVECVIVLNPNISSPVTSDASDEIQLHRLRCEVAEALGEANRMANHGNIAGAQNLLKNAVVRVQGSRVHKRKLAVHLTQTVQASLEGMESRDTYECHGKAVIQNYAGSHWQQRSNCSPTYTKAQNRSIKQLPPRPVPRSQETGGGGACLQPPVTTNHCSYRNPAKSKLITACTINPNLVKSTTADTVPTKNQPKLTTAHTVSAPAQLKSVIADHDTVQVPTKNQLKLMNADTIPVSNQQS